MAERYLGIDLGAESIKVAELVRVDGALQVARTRLVEHEKDPAGAIVRLLPELGWDDVTAAAATGRVSRLLALERVPTKAALARGVGHVFPEAAPCTVVSIGSHGFSVLELRGEDNHVYRENARCSQGTGNFLRQLVERFDLSVEEASALSADVEHPAALSGRCPVILKTDMTHLANKGEDRAQILAGLYDAVCENVQVLLKPAISPPRVLLAGGVVRAPRVRDNFRRFLAARNMSLVDSDPEEGLFLEAIGAALIAASHGGRVPDKGELIVNAHETELEHVPALHDALQMVRRMPPIELADDGAPHEVVLGFDMGSTGSKAVAIDVAERRPLWEGYLNTLGNPVRAAQQLADRFLEETDGRHTVRAIGATGSGREIVGSLMSSCYGADNVFVLNEIAAHAEGALSFDSEVDTIFEIGGQDAKYIRLDGGRISDAAMNEACSAGTGSFIEEQGRKFQDVQDVVQMGQLAAKAPYGISLGQHCSVFMAEVIDEAVSAGEAQEAILAGIYDSVIQNYLNRVKGNRSVGERIFCQGMPFMADALAAAVARQTGRTVIVPPNPGTIGAYGIALLTIKEILGQADAPAEALSLERFLSASVDKKDTFVCKSKKGCGGAGNHCRIDRIFTTAGGEKQRFVWGGNCSLYDAGTKKRKLPDRAPDPFRERSALIDTIIEQVSVRTGRPLVAMTDEFALKGLFPFFATFIRELGFDIKVWSNATQTSLKRGIEEANVPFCAPMQIYQGLTAEIFDEKPDIALLPRMRDLPRQGEESHATTCPLVQASPDMIRTGIGADHPTRLVAPRIDMGPGNLRSKRFLTSVRLLGAELGAEEAWEAAYEAGLAAQDRFDAACRAIGSRALDFAEAHPEVIAVVVLGRAYTIYNTVLNSNVPTLLREQGAVAIPVDCYPLSDDTPIFEEMFWAYGQLNLRAAHQIRRTDGVYGLFCSNYACGPDSFNLHFFSYIMENKPFAIIETDGHSGDAGTKTRIEAFLYCVEGDRRLEAGRRAALKQTNFKALAVDRIGVGDVKRRGELLLIPRMGAGAEMLAACFAAEGLRAEALPLPTRESLRLGRRYTSGKECVPMTITLGSLLQRLETEPSPDERFAFFMPTAFGPCRFGVYNLLHKILLEKAGWRDRVNIVAPDDQDYFKDVSKDFQVRAFVGFLSADLLQMAYQDVRPRETRKGAAREIYERFHAELAATIRVARSGGLAYALGELPNGMYGVRNLLRRAAKEMLAVRDDSVELPTVSVVGEIYARLDPFANDYVIERLQDRGLRPILAPFIEWLEYTTYTEMQRIKEDRALPGDSMAGARFTYALETGVIDSLYGEMAKTLGWGPRTTVDDSLAAGAPYISPELMGEAVLTLGGPVHEYESGHIDGVVSVGPHECMPSKIAEAQFAHVAEEKGLISLTLPLNGDPVDPEILDRFAFEVKERWAARRAAGVTHGAPTAPRWKPELRNADEAMPPTRAMRYLRDRFLPQIPPALQGKALMTALRALTPLRRDKDHAGPGA